MFAKNRRWNCLGLSDNVEQSSLGALGLFHATAIFVTNERFNAHAAGSAPTFHAFGRFGNFATGQTIQLNAASVVLFFVGGAMRLGRNFVQRDVDRGVGRFELFAFGRRDTYAFFVFQIAFFAKASGSASNRAPRLEFRHGARRAASRSASRVDFIFAAFGRNVGLRRRVQQSRNLLRDSMPGIAIVWTNASTVGRFQVAFLAEATVDARQNANRSRIRIGASWNAGGTALASFGFFAAFLTHRRRQSHSEADGQNREQQQGRKAKGHRERLVTENLVFF